jgi:hypothetical protein
MSKTNDAELATTGSIAHGLEHWETQVKMGTYLTMVALKVIRDEEMYKDAGYESFDIYRRDRITFISQSHADRLLMIADQFGTSETVATLIGDTTNMKNLSDLAKNRMPAELQEARLMIGDQEVPVDEFLESKRDEMRDALAAEDKLQAARIMGEMDELKKEMKKLKKQVSNSESQIKKQTELTQLTEEELRKTTLTLQNVTTGNIDQERLIQVTNASEARTVILQAYSELSRQISIVNDIPESISEDPEVLQHISMLESEIDALRGRLHERWGTYLGV